MARRISTGTVGSNVLGALTTLDNSLQSVVANANVRLQPNGTGVVESTTHLQISNGNTLRLADNDSSAYVALKSPATLSATYTLTFPGDDGAVNQVLRTDGSGVLTWVAPFVAVSNTIADGTIHYPALTTATSGTISTVTTSNTKLSFVPSTGTLTSTEMRVSASTASSTTASGALVVTGGVGIGGQLTAVSIVETSSIALKENIMPINDALGSILQLRGVTYDRIDTKEHEAGLIAEWVDTVLPDLVAKNEQGEAIGIKYTKLTAYLIEAIKSLKQEINELQGSK
jgi:hypothetical protein